VRLRDNTYKGSSFILSFRLHF